MSKAKERPSKPVNYSLDSQKITFDFLKAHLWSAADILPEKEAEPYIPDFKYLSRKRQMIRNLYESPGTSLKVDGRKVQQLIDDHIRSLNVSELVKSREVTDENFLVDILKFKSDRARTALVKNRAKLVIKELASHNPVYYEKLRERLEKIIREEEQRRKENANYFNNYKEILQEALEEDKERKKLGFSNLFEFAVYEELLEVFKDKKIAMGATRRVSSIVNDEIQIVGWKTKTSSDKKMSIAIYDILNENKIPETRVDGLTSQIIELAKRNL